MFCFFSEGLVEDYHELIKFLGRFFVSQAMGSYQTQEDLEELRWWINPTDKNMVMTQDDYYTSSLETYKLVGFACRRRRHELHFEPVALHGVRYN